MPRAVLPALSVGCAGPRNGRRGASETAGSRRKEHSRTAARRALIAGRARDPGLSPVAPATAFAWRRWTCETEDATHGPWTIGLGLSVRLARVSASPSVGPIHR